MFSFFKKNKVTINSFTIPQFGWERVEDTSSVLRLVNADQTIVIGKNFFEMRPDIPTVKDIELLCRFFRDMLSDSNTGIVEVDIKQKNNLSFTSTIFKIPQHESGMTYTGSLIFPFESCSFVLKVTAAESSPTGMREAIVGNKLLAKGEVNLTEKGIEGWAFDPYDSKVQSGVLMNKAEAPEYDDEFPDHPLSRVRKLMKQIEDEVIWSPEVEKLKPFNK